MGKNSFFLFTSVFATFSYPNFLICSFNKASYEATLCGNSLEYFTFNKSKLLFCLDINPKTCNKKKKFLYIICSRFFQFPYPRLNQIFLLVCWYKTEIKFILQIQMTRGWFLWFFFSCGCVFVSISDENVSKNSSTSNSTLIDELSFLWTIDFLLTDNLWQSNKWKRGMGNQY